MAFAVGSTLLPSGSGTNSGTAYLSVASALRFMTAAPHHLANIPVQHCSGDPDALLAKCDPSASAQPIHLPTAGKQHCAVPVLWHDLSQTLPKLAFADIGVQFNVVAVAEYFENLVRRQAQTQKLLDARAVSPWCAGSLDHAPVQKTKKRV